MYNISRFAKSSSTESAHNAIAAPHEGLQQTEKVRSWGDERQVLNPREIDTKFATSRRAKFRYWVIPVILSVVCFSIQSLLPHVTTQLYIKYMNKADIVIPSEDIFGDCMVNMAKNVTSDIIGQKVDVPMKPLGMTGLSSLLLYASTYTVTTYLGDSQIELWAKTFLVASAMALLKCMFDSVTVLPDSCDVDFNDDFAKSMVSLVIMEILGVKSVRGRVRYYTDMTVSGHTYFAVLFSLSTYKMLRYQVSRRGMHRIRYVVAIICAACIITEVVLVASSKFHYTADMLASIVLVSLFWDSVHFGTITAAFVAGYSFRDPDHYGQGPLFCPFRSRSIRDEAGFQPRICASFSRELVNLHHMREIKLPNCVNQKDDENDGTNTQESNDRLPMMCRRTCSAIRWAIMYCHRAAVCKP